MSKDLADWLAVHIWWGIDLRRRICYLIHNGSKHPGYISTANTGNHWTEIQPGWRATVSYVGNYFEWSAKRRRFAWAIGFANCHGSNMMNSYYAGTTRLAVREVTASQNKLYYLLTDHLGSTAKAVEANTNTVAMELRYKPWGEVRYSSGTGITDYTFTGQKSEMADIGLLFYMSRFYDPALGRFIQADSIVPEPGNPLAWDRYAYTLNNPVKYIDPSGHLSCDAKYVASGDCDPNNSNATTILSMYYEVELVDWGGSDAVEIYIGINAVGISLNNYLDAETPGEAFSNFFDPLTITSDGQRLNQGWFCEVSGCGGFSCQGASGHMDSQLTVHELGHIFANTSLKKDFADPYGKLGTPSEMEGGINLDIFGNWVFGAHANGEYERTELGFNGLGPPFMYHGPRWDDWNSNVNNVARNEDFADMFMNFVFNTFDYSNGAAGAGYARYNWFDTNMADWIR